jgi:hypothetical protein
MIYIGPLAEFIPRAGTATPAACRWRARLPGGQRALYAALRMQEEMGRYSSKLREAGNPPIEARVGINTG